MNTIKTITAKNGQTYYYLDGKRISKADALALMAQVETATPSNDEPQADVPKAQIMPSSLPRFDFVAKQTDYIKRQELLAQRTHYIKRRCEQAKATLKGLSKVSAVAFLLIAILAFGGLLSSAVTITSITAILVVSAPLMLVAYRSQTDAVDKLKSEQESCLLKVGEYADPEHHLSSFLQTKVGNYNHTRLVTNT